MHRPNRPVTPIAAVAGGALAGAVGTVCLDAVHYLKYRGSGGEETPLQWEFAPIDGWEKAPAPGQLARRLAEGFTQRKIPDRWAYGSLAGAAYGVLAGSRRRPDPLGGVPFGAALFAVDYIALPVAGLYEPVWRYDAMTLAWDLGAHLCYGAGTGTAFWLLTKII